MKLKPMALAVRESFYGLQLHQFGSLPAELEAHLKALTRLNFESMLSRTIRELNDNSGVVRYYQPARQVGKSQAAKVYLEQFGTRTTKRGINNYIISMDEAT